MAKYVGTPLKRREDPRFIQGRGSYVANLKLPGMAYLAIKRSPYAHARIKSINTTRARNLWGVIDVFTGEDTKDLGNMPTGWNVPGIKMPVQRPLQTDKVRHVGDRVAMVVAESAAIAADALDLIDVEYEPLPSVTDARAAAAEGAPLVHDEIANNISYTWALGNKDECDQAFAEADKVVELELVNQRLIATAMEPRAAVAQWDSSKEEMTLWTTSQNPNLTRIVLSAFILFIPEHKLRLISPDVGGGFGSKVPTYPEEALVPWAARKIGRPVKWVSTRTEASLSDTQGRDHVTQCKLALKNDGTMTGLRVTTWANNGAYISTLAPAIPTALYITLLSGMYKIRGVYGDMYGTLSNTVWVDAYRGAGRPEAAYVVERLVDLAALELKMDPVAIRRKNFIPAGEFPYQTPVAFLYDSGNYAAVMDQAVKMADYPAMRAAQAEARQAGRLVGIGIGACIEASGAGPSQVAGALGGVTGLWEMGGLRVHATGKVTALTGSHSHGQGHETTFAQIVADELGINMDDVDVVHGDTAVISNGMGTYGSRSTSVGASALVRSADKVKLKMRKIAAHQLEAPLDDVIYDAEQGKAYVKGVPSKAKTFGELAFAAFTAHNLPDDIEPGMEEDTYYNPANFTFPNSIHIAQVEIDRETGEVTIQRYVAVDDVGKVINPLIVEGQVIGGVVQGIGQALTEHGFYNSDGQLVAGNLLEYALPRASRFPHIENGRTETPSPVNPLGVKGVGEMGTIASTPTIVNAVMDALAPLGVRHIDMPLTPEKIWRAIEKGKA
jgi:aerobic carbon-monoxide dehydrogenase large subunit